MIAMLEQARRQHLVNLFSGRKLETKKLIAASSAATVASDAAGVASATAAAGTTAVAPGARSGARAAESEIKELLGGLFNLDTSILEEIAVEIGAEALTATVGALSEAAPFLGTTVSGTRAMVAWGKTARDAHRKRKVGKQADGVLPGDPAAAVAAVERLVARERNMNALIATRLTAQASVQATADALTIAEVGTAPVTFGGTAVLAAPTAMVGPAASVVGSSLALVHRLYLIGRDYNEKRKANKRLAQPSTLDASIFGVCPILGCYLLTCADTSQIINIPLDRMLTDPKFMDQVERMNKDKVQPLLVRASKLIIDHRFTLSGLESESEHGIRMISKGKLLRGDGMISDLKRAKARGIRDVKHAVRSAAKRAMRRNA